MKLIECEKPVREGYCSDNDCSCVLTPIPHGEGYIYISEDVVTFRADKLSLEETRLKIDKLQKQTGEYISVCSYSPILVCKESAIKRNLDLTIAAQDAASFWNSATVPLRATPLAQNSSDPQELYSSIPDHPPIVLKQAHSEETPPVAVTSFTGSKITNSTASKITPSQPSKERNVFESKKPGSITEKSPSVSVDDIVAQYASGPLAEMAKRMANDLKGNGPSIANDVAANNFTETKITLNTGNKTTDNTYIASRIASIDLYDNDSVDNVDFNSDSTIQNQPTTNYRNKKRIPRRNKIKIFLFTLIPLSIAIAGSVLFVMLRTKKPARVTLQPAIIEKTSESSIKPILTRDFFESAYIFEDIRFEGIISFKDIDNNRGIYNLDVRLKGKTISDSVKGTFSFTEQEISFKPDGQTLKIIWNVEELDPDGNHAIFFDPLLENREKARIFLTRK